MLRALLLVCGLALWLGCTFTGHGAEYKYIESGEKLSAYPLKTGKISVYQNSDREKKIDTVAGKNLSVAISKVEGDSFYGTYKKGGKKLKGWFAEAVFVEDPLYGKVDGMARYSAKVYKRKSGASYGKIPAYAKMDLIGKSGNWCQVIYKYQSGYRIGWLKKTSYDKIARIYDGTEKRPMAEGIYTVSPKSSSSKRMAAADGSVALAKAGSGKKQKFEFQFMGDSCYRIVSCQSKLCLSAEGEEGNYGKNVVLIQSSGEAEPGQLWKLTRSGGYYYVKNMGSGRYLKAGTEFTTGKKSSSSKEQFKIAMSGGKNKENWQVFTQYDPEWGGKKYGKTNTMAGSACGILSMTNAVYALNGQFFDPMELADYSVKHHYRVEHHGTDYRLFKAASAKFGEDYGFSYAGSTTSLSTLKKHLKSGGTAIAYVPGHYIAVADYKKGKYLVLDSYARSKRKTSPFGDWIKGSRFQSGGLKAKNFFLFQAR